jgi:hypothetical protein
MTTKLSSHKLALAITASIMAACAASAIEAPLTFFGTNMPPIDFHGFASQGYIVNSGNDDYLGGKSSQGTFDFREYGVNASMAYDKWRIGAQFFGQKLGQYGDDEIKLDWGTVDYQAAQWFGLRAGRVKTPRGLYNETLDLDSTRAFVLLPQSVYDARLRDFQASFDGGMAYGNIEMGKAGSLDYKAFGGNIPMSTSSGASDYFNVDAPFPNLAIHMDDAFGGSLFWNTPVQGLRIGYSASDYQNLYTLRSVPGVGNLYKNAPNYVRQLASVEYTRGDWVFAAEGGFDNAKYNVGVPGGAPSIYLYQNNFYYYASATYRVNHWLQLGSYFSYTHWQQRNVNATVSTPNLNQADTALSARFDITDYLIFKIEAHYMQGAGEVFSMPSDPQPLAGRTDSWAMLDAKVTLSF